MPKILFISHDASRTGAPILLLNLASVLVAHSDFQISFLVNRSPLDLLDRFKTYPVTIARRSSSHQLWSRLGRKIGVLPPGINLRKLRRSLEGVDIVMSNTITNGDLLAEIRRYFDGPIITYVHELRVASKHFTTPANLERVLKLSAGFFVPSLAVKKYLIKECCVPEGRISILNYYVPIVRKMLQRSECRPFTVGAAGTVDWRKSPDLFVQVAHWVFNRFAAADIKFVWKGAYAGIELDRLMLDVDKLGLAGKVTFEMAGENMEEFYSNIDLFLLTSREDPYPLVVLEAAAANVPSICFENAGGAVEFIRGSAGGSYVDYLDTLAMADQVIYFSKNQEVCKRAGLAANAFLQKTHLDAGYIARQFKTAVSRYLAL